MPFRKRAKGLKGRGKQDDVKSLSAPSNGVPVVGAGNGAPGHNAAPVDSASRRTKPAKPVKRSATVSKPTSGQGGLRGAANKRRLLSSAAAQSSGHGSSLDPSRDTVGSPSRRGARQAPHKAGLATDLWGRKTAGALSAGGQIRKGRPLPKVTGNSKVDDSQQATSTPATVSSKRTSRSSAKAGGTGYQRSAEKLEGHADVLTRSGAAGSSHSKPADAPTNARKVSSPRGPDLVAKQLPKPTSALSAAEQSNSAPSGVPSAPPTNRAGRGRPAKCAVNTKKAGEQAVRMSPRQKCTAHSTAEPKPNAPPTTGAGRTRAVAGINKGLTTKQKLAKGKIIKSKNTTQQSKKAAARGCAKQKQVQKKQGASLDAEEVSSDATDSSYVVPRGLLQPYRRKDRFFDDYVKPWEEEEGFWSDSESEDISNASISSIIPPPGLLQPCRQKKLNATSSEDRLSELDADDEQDLSARCRRIFGMDTLPNSTTTKAEAISMLVSFVSSRRLPWGALAELVTLVNKLFAPADNVLPDSKALANVLSLMP